MTQTEEGKPSSYAEAVSQLQNVLLTDNPTWLKPCVNLKIQYFARTILTVRKWTPYVVERDGADLVAFLNEPYKLPLSNSPERSDTNLITVFQRIRADAQGASSQRKMFLIISDLAHDVSSLEPPDRRDAAKRDAVQDLAEEIGKNPDAWSVFDDVDRRLLVSFILPARSRDTQEAQNAVLDNLRGLQAGRKGVLLLKNPSRDELEETIMRSLSYLYIDAVRSADENGWDVNIKNFSDQSFRADLLLRCATEDPRSSRSQGPALRIPALNSVSAVQPDPFSIGSSLPTTVEAPSRCTIEVFGIPEDGSGKRKLLLGTITVDRGIFIDLDLDYVRPKLDFPPSEGATAKVIFKLRGQLGKEGDNCKNVRIDLLARRGDATYSLLADQDTKLIDVLDNRGEPCSLHPRQWRVFCATLKLNRNAREVPLCGHEPPPLVFRVSVLPQQNSTQDEDMWKHRHEEEAMPRHEANGKGHDFTREIILPIFVSVVIMSIVLATRRGRIGPEDLGTLFTSVFVVVGGLYSLLHEYTTLGRMLENCVESNGPFVALILGFSIILFAFFCWYRGLFSVDLGSRTIQARLPREAVSVFFLFRRLMRLAPWAVAALVIWILYIATSEKEWEHQCVYQDVYVPQNFFDSKK
jgi:hypothetical protein